MSCSGQILRIAIVLIAAFGVCQTQLAGDESIRLKNGLTLSGGIVNVAGMNQNPFAVGGGNVKANPIIMVDDGLRRTYMYERGMVVGERKPVRGIERTIAFDFKPPLNGKAIAGLGAILRVSPFNEYGRRIVVVRGPKGGDTRILQGIVELNARYAHVEALKDRPSYKWDMRVATSSIDSATLRAIFKRRLLKPNLTRDQQFDMRLEHVRFFIEADRYADAHQELVETIKEFPEQPNMEARLIEITERQASQLIKEAMQRAEVGQEPFAKQILQTFPLQAVGRVTRLEVQDALAKLNKTQQTIDETVAKLQQQSGQLNARQIQSLEPILAEIQAGLSAATLPRLSDYMLQRDNAAMPLENRVALAVSGWLLGSGAGIQNMSVAISMIQVRDLVHEYLGSDDEAQRKAILDKLANIEGADAEYIARMLPLLTPTKTFPADAAHDTIEGMFTMGLDQTVDSLRAAPRYVIQLPPNYDPLREYPCVVALHPPQGTPEQQLDWWAGIYDAGMKTRLGHATRHGYIVVAPAWTRQGQGVYEYSPREHQRVLVAVRDAMRRASIDADRVFLVGHGGGATAAWDIAVSHPDIWAGMIAIRPDPDKTITHYGDNARHLPIYIVLGDLDGVRTKNNHAFGGVLDHYVNVRADAMVTMYKGWGFAFFFEEIHNLFDWMNVKLHRRKEIPQDIECKTMRAGDEFFWWLELDGLKAGTAVDPILWDKSPDKPRIRGKIVEASVGAKNQIRIVQAPADRFTIWMRPGMGVDIGQRVTIRYGTRPFYHDYNGEIKTLLEDTRQRADRKRPYWTKVTVP